MPIPTQLPADKPPHRTIRERLEALRDLINNRNTEPDGLNWGQATAIARDLDSIIEDLPAAPEKPEHGLPGKPGLPAHPDQGLPGDRPEKPDHGLPSTPARPDHELPETPDPKRGSTPGRR